MRRKKKKSGKRERVKKDGQHLTRRESFFFRELGRKRLYRESFREEFGAW